MIHNLTMEEHNETIYRDLPGLRCLECPVPFALAGEMNLVDGRNAGPIRPFAASMETMMKT